MCKIKQLVIMLAPILLLCCQSADAVSQYRGAYIGFSGGYVSSNQSDTQLLKAFNDAISSNSDASEQLTGIDSSVTNEGVAGQFFVGMAWSDYFAAEFNYTYFQNATYNNITPNPTTDIKALSASTGEQTLNLVAKPSLPLFAGLSLYAKGGFSYMIADMQVDYTHRISRDVVSETESYYAFSPVYGGGIEYHVNDNVVLGMGWDHWNGGGNIPQADYYGMAFSYHWTPAKRCGQFLC